MHSKFVVVVVVVVVSMLKCLVSWVKVIRKGWLSVNNPGFMKVGMSKEYWFVLTGKLKQNALWRHIVAGFEVRERAIYTKNLVSAILIFTIGLA